MRQFLLGTIIFIFSILIITAFISRIQIRTKPTEAQFTSIDLAESSSTSVVNETTTATQFFISSDKKYLYKSTNDNVEAALEFLSKDPEVVDSNVKGASTITTKKIKKKLLPQSISQKIALVRKKSDPDGSKHFYFSQKIGNTPVFGSTLSVHMRNKGEIYAVIGSLSLPDSVPAAEVPLTKAEEIARNAAEQLINSKYSLQVVNSSLTIFNAGLIEKKDSAQNLPAAVVTVADSSQYPTYGEKLVISLIDGAVLYRQPLIEHLLNRRVVDCDGGLTTCPVVRTEGSVVSNRRDADLMYTFLGDTYNFYQSSFQRDSYDNIGSELLSFVNVTDPEVGCPNAAWIPSPYSRLLVCPNMVANDVIGHEMTHGVIEHTANLLMNKQSGALNEGIADIFSFGLDNDWTMAEDTTLGVLRNAQNPPSDNPPHPDRLFSQYYTCTSSDQGGVHANATVITKTFYLMSMGGTFNGCTIAPVGKDVAHKIWYRALTTYLSSTSNYAYAYLMVLQACSDLYGATSSTCGEVAKAFQATEIDQQPTDTVEGARCLNITRQTPLCAVSATATSVPSPSASPTPTPSFSPSPTLTPMPGCPLKNKGDANCNNTIDLVDFEIWRKEFTGSLSTKNADFNASGAVDIVDFELWRKGMFGQ